MPSLTTSPSTCSGPTTKDGSARRCRTPCGRNSAREREPSQRASHKKGAGKAAQLEQQKAEEERRKREEAEKRAALAAQPATRGKKSKEEDLVQAPPRRPHLRPFRGDRCRIDAARRRRHAAATPSTRGESLTSSCAIDGSRRGPNRTRNRSMRPPTSS